ncbi:S-adenosyl-L-methionine-dependent methyltransferase [Lyophyllum atratum]|nr:S-adenosyl-L-methionine-dependent methyltransferase [Lyophyllum atratum]
MRREKKTDLPELCSTEDVLWRDVIAVLGQDVVDKALEEGTEFDSPFEFHQEVELEISSICSSGEAIARSSDDQHPWTVILPFALPGEKVLARIYRNARLHSFADLLKVITPNPALRDDSRVKCQYFGSCAGCQYQMLSYETQLDLKRDVVVKAYRNFSDLPETSIPPILSTIGSPLEYGYRTKLTPHFEAPPKSARKHAAETEGKPDWLKIGFNRIGTSRTMDIEECPIATPVINDAYRPMRENIIKNIFTYKKGVSLLLRDSLEPASDASPRETDDPVDALSTSLEKHVCITNPKATVREKVGDWIFEYNAGSFFQNNNSVLVPLTTYVRDAIFPTSLITTDSDASQPTHLVDAYCGAGLFAITLSPHFQTVAGIELSRDSIKAATHNAQLNNIPSDKVTFRAGDAADIFATVGEFPPDRSVLLIDPPRKGCDDNFIRQLLDFRCKTVVYVSCNVHTQARDVGKILKATENEEVGRKYVLESIRGFDLFPQTAHVESVAVLRLV